jgi:hypothetical protein
MGQLWSFDFWTSSKIAAAVSFAVAFLVNGFGLLCSFFDSPPAGLEKRPDNAAAQLASLSQDNRRL